jgi:hypothetical protein
VEALTPEALVTYYVLTSPSRRTVQPRRTRRNAVYPGARPDADGGASGKA